MVLMKRLSQWARSANALVSRVESSHPGVSPALRKLRLSKPFAPSPEAVQAYQSIIADKVALIERLPSKYRKDIQELIWNSVMKGYDAAGLAHGLSDRFGIAPDRAQLIARSQCNMARSVMMNVERMQKGIREAVWQYEARCAIPSHRTYAGRRYLLARGANLDGKWVWPGSESTCQCSSLEINGAEDE